MLNFTAIKSKVWWGLFLTMSLVSLGLYGCGSNSSSTLKVTPSTQSPSNPVASLPGSYTVAAADLPISPPAIPATVQVSAAAAASVTITSLGGGQVQVTLPPNSLPASQFPPVGSLVKIGSAPATSGTYNGTFTVIASDASTQSFTINAPYVGPLAAGATPTVQQQIVATPITAAAPSTTTPGQTTIAAPNTLTNGTPVTIVGSSMPSLNGPNTATNTTPQSFDVTATIPASPAPGTPVSTSTTSTGTNLGVVLTGGGVLPAAQCATTTTGTAGAITLPKSVADMDIVPSRFTGVAPLGVFFDATGTTATATTKPFHELGYHWNFGDDPTQLWANGVHVNDGTNLASKNYAAGPIAAHVFETPGTYIVNLTVTDGTNTVSNSCVQIAVQDPNIVYAGTNTVCIANNTATAGSGGCPAGAATPAGTSDFQSALAACINNNTRCLFKQGDAFTFGGTVHIGAISNWSIGTYGTSGVSPTVTSTGTTFTPITFNGAAADGRIAGLELIGGGSTDTGLCLAINSPVNEITVLGVSCHDIGKGFIMQSGIELVGSVFQDNHIYNINAASGGVGIFGWANNSAYLGNYIGPFSPQAEHNVRLEPGQKVVISDNTITTPGISGKSVITVRADEHQVPCPVYPGCVTTYPAGTPLADTQYVYISDNKLIGGTSSGASPQILQIGPASNTQNDWISDVIAERNWIIFGPGTLQGQQDEANNVTIRNNICDSSLGSTTQYCFNNDHTNTAGVQPPNDNWFYNNTCYSNGAPKLNCVTLSYSGYPANPVTTTNSVVENNLAYAPSANSPTLLLVNNGATGIIGASGSCGNSSDSIGGTGDQIALVDPWASASPVNPIDFTPNTGSYAIGGGTTGISPCVPVPVWSDFFPAWSHFFLTTEPAPRNIGAVNH